MHSASSPLSDWDTAGGILDVATVVADFRKALPGAEIFVYDNNSSDRTAAAVCGSAGVDACAPGAGV